MRIFTLLLLLPTFCFAEPNEIGWSGDGFNVGSLHHKLEKSVTITADDEVVVPGKRGTLKIDSDSVTQTSRSFVLQECKVKGKEIEVRCNVTGTNKAEILDDADIPTGGKMKLAGDWACTQKFDNISFRCTGSPGNHWIETGRADL